MTAEQLILAEMVRQLRATRDAREWSRERLASELNINSAVIADLEMGRNARMLTLIRIAGGLGYRVTLQPDEPSRG